MLRTAIQEANRTIYPDMADFDPWTEYRRDAAAINTLLPSLFGITADGDVEDASFGSIPDHQVRKTRAVDLDTSLMRSALRGYQAFGAQFALLQKDSIIGDEMGLGKSIQAIAVAAHLAVKGESHTLVVCPASVVINWRNEIHKHSRLDAYLLHGAERDEATQEWLDRGGVGITTYGTLGRLPIPRGSRFAFVIVDEAHMVKNPRSQRSQVVQRMLNSAGRTVLLTGTPMENRVEEFRTLIGYQRQELARRLDLHGALLGDARAFRRAVAPVYLRRNQVDVLKELPDRIEVEDWVEPTGEDTRHYAAATHSRNFMAMRQAAYAAAGAGKSAKFERLLEIVEESAQEGRKVIVFSYFLDVLQDVASVLGGKAVGPLTGAMPAARRQELVDEFTNRPDPCVLVSQIEAGGVGLNIQAASVVIITEPQWKPSTETQAIARAHRMGRVDTVLVHRLLAKNTVDERIRELLEHKTALFGAYARPSDAKEADSRAVDGSMPPMVGSQPPMSMVKQIVAVERRRLGYE